MSASDTSSLVGKRVVVFDSEDSSEGKPGVYAGSVTVYVILSPVNQAIRSLKFAEQRPSPEEVAAVPDGEVAELHNNPKIILDSGEVIYGCQVWWNWA